MKPINKYLVNRHITKKDTTNVTRNAGKPIKDIDVIKPGSYFVIVVKNLRDFNNAMNIYPTKIIGKCISVASKKYSKLTTVDIYCKFLIPMGAKGISKIIAHDNCSACLPTNELRYPNVDEMSLIEEIENFLLANPDVERKALGAEIGQYDWNTNELTLNAKNSVYNKVVDVDAN